MSPDLFYERQLTGIICGVDEAGRGPWAGPVVAAAVILDFSKPIPDGIEDSKKLTRGQREALFPILRDHYTHAFGIASVEEIDTVNILEASMIAMARAVEGLGTKVDAALIDGNRAPDLSCLVYCVVKGDGRSLSIAAASILAKVRRDAIMCEIAREFPHYGFEKHAGYGTAYHQAALREHGPCRWHRRSFAPIKALLETLEEVA